VHTSSVRTRLLVVFLVPALLGLGGCGGSDPGADPQDGTVAIPEDLCDSVSAEALSEALGVTVTTEVGPSGDCEFDAEDPRGLSGTIGVVASADTNGGYAGYVSGIDATLKDPQATTLSGLGDAAVVKTGLPTMGSENLMAAGVVDHGSYLFQVTLAQAQGMTAADLAEAAEKALRLVDTETR